MRCFALGPRRYPCQGDLGLAEAAKNPCLDLPRSGPKPNSLHQWRRDWSLAIGCSPHSCFTYYAWQKQRKGFHGTSYLNAETRDRFSGGKTRSAVVFLHGYGAECVRSCWACDRWLNILPIHCSLAPIAPEACGCARPWDSVVPDPVGSTIGGEGSRTRLIAGQSMT